MTKLQIDAYLRKYAGRHTIETMAKALGITVPSAKYRLKELHLSQGSEKALYRKTIQLNIRKVMRTHEFSDADVRWAMRWN